MAMDLIEATKQAIESGQVTQSGKPLVSDLEKMLGRDITAAERDQAYEAVRAAGQEDRVVEQTDPEPAEQLIYTGPNTIANGVPVLKYTVFINGLPDYMSGLKKACKPLSELTNKKR